MGITKIAGIDEAGRGPLAGPVTAAAFMVTFDCVKTRRGWKVREQDDIVIADSKLMTPLERERAYEYLIAHCPYGVASVAAEVIDRCGILRATNLAMQRAVAKLQKIQSPALLLVDGRYAFTFPVPHRSIVRGDRTEFSIAAASIIAKVTRDRWMVKIAKQFPRYGFEIHKGYGTEFHRRAIKRHGLCKIHRTSFTHRVSAVGGRKKVGRPPQ